MNVNIQRLCRARTSLPFLVKRYAATVAASDPPAPKLKKEFDPQGISSKFGIRPEIARRQFPKHIDKWLGSDIPTIFKHLVDNYQVDGHLSQQTPGSEVNGLPGWGESGIDLKFRMFRTVEICHLPNFWLRDNCRCAKCVNQDTMQKAFDTFSIPPDIKPNSVITRENGLEIEWANDGHTSLYPWAWVRKYRRTPYVDIVDYDSRFDGRNHFWGREIKGKPPSVSYDEIMADDKGVGLWTSKIREYGFCYVEGCPVSPEATKVLLERIAFIRETHYGGFYDFTSDLTLKDTAYTSLALGAHTDTTYFTDPAGLQMFHLLSHTEGEGGASLLVDGFHAAKKLKDEDPDAFEALSDISIPCHASGNEGVIITPAKNFPVLNFGTSYPWLIGRGVRSNRARADLIQVRWNNDDRAVLDMSIKHTVRWYDAARKFDKILKSDEMQYWAQLEPGRPLIFDNWRVLHGRSSFTGKRRICGGYINHDDFISRWRTTSFSREEALNQIM